MPKKDACKHSGQIDTDITKETRHDGTQRVVRVVATCRDCGASWTI